MTLCLKRQNLEGFPHNHIEGSSRDSFLLLKGFVNRYIVLGWILGHMEWDGTVCLWVGFWPQELKENSGIGWVELGR